MTCDRHSLGISRPRSGNEECRGVILGGETQHHITDGKLKKEENMQFQPLTAMKMGLYKGSIPSEAISEFRGKYRGNKRFGFLLAVPEDAS